MTPVELLLSNLPNAKRQGKEWAARCPAHEDKRPSLSIIEGEGGRALLHCHAGCTAKAVTAAMGLTLADLMGDSPMTKKSPAATPGKEKSNAMTLYATIDTAVAALERTHGQRANLWTYHAATDEPVGALVRWNTATGKTIRPLAKVQGGWAVGAMAEPRPVYQLPALAARGDDVVYIVEGEKCADAMSGLGLLATTSCGGASAASKADWTPWPGETW